MNRKRMSGAALLVLMGLILIALTTIAVARLSLNNLQSSRITSDAKILAQARDALLGYALQQAPVGRLPCPDRTGDGKADPIAGGCRTRRGWLPFRDLRLPDLRDNSGARLWYAVDPAYTLATVTDTTPSSLSLDGSNVVAVVLTPKDVLAGQTRIIHTANFTDNFNADLLVTGYLEGVHSVANPTQFTNVTGANQNDQVIGMKVTEFWNEMDPLLP